MITSALIVLDDESAHVRVFGLVWIDYALRVVTRTSIAHVVVVVDRVPAPLGEIVDRARSTGIACTLARSTAELAYLFHPDESVLLVGGTRLFDAALLEELNRAGHELLLCTSEARGPAFERIDAGMWWTGLARIAGARVRDTAGAPGDWNAGSLLMRSAVQAGVERRAIGAKAVLDANEPVAVATFEAASIRAHPPRPEGCGSLVVEPAAALLARRLSHRLAATAAVAPVLAGALSVVAILVAFFRIGHPVAIAAACVVLAKTAAALARIASAAVAAVPRAGPTLRDSIDAAAGLALVAAAVVAPADGASSLPALTVVAPVVVALTWLCRRVIAAVPSPPRWWPDVVGQALLIGTVAAVAPGLVTAALVTATVYACVGLAWLQDKVNALLSMRD